MVLSDYMSLPCCTGVSRLVLFYSLLISLLWNGIERLYLMACWTTWYLVIGITHCCAEYRRDGSWSWVYYGSRASLVSFVVSCGLLSVFCYLEALPPFGPRLADRRVTLLYSLLVSLIKSSCISKKKTNGNGTNIDCMIKLLFIV